jgi:hypothetical protein
MSPQSMVSEGAALYSAGRTLGLPDGLLVLVISAPTGDGLLTCGGAALVPQPPPACSLPACGTGTIRPGHRLADPVSGLEVVCTRAGHGLLTFAGRVLQHQAAAPDHQGG